MAGTALKCLAILHHGLDGIGVEGSGETLGLALHSLHNGHGHPFLGKLGIDLEHQAGFGFSLLAGGMGGVALLPEELTGAQEGTGAHLPAHDVAPLVAHEGQVAPRLYPVFVGVPDDGLGSGAYDKFFFELGSRVDHYPIVGVVGLQAVVCHHGAFFCKTLYMLGLAREERLRDKEGEIGVLRTRLLEHGVELVLHFLPYSIAVGLDDHASADGRLLGEVGLDDEVVIPLTVVVSTLCEFF